MAFSEIITDGRLVDEMKMGPSIILPLMRVAVKIGPSMLSFGKKIQQRRSVTHTLDRTYATIWIGVVVPKDKGRLLRSFVEFFGEPVQLLLSQVTLSS
jgi:hypothetical protein